MLLSALEPPPVRLAARKYRCNEHFFDVLDADTAYWLGYVMADGCVSLRNRHNSQQAVFSVASKDKPHLERLRRTMQCTYPVHGPYKGTYQLTITSWPLCLGLEQWNVVPRKSHTLQLPALPGNLLPHVFRGLIDGDGCFNTYRRRSRAKKHNGKGRPACPDRQVLTLCLVGSRPVCQAFKTHFGKGSVARKGKVWQYTLTGDAAASALRWMYDCEGPALLRKKRRLRQLKIVR